LHEDIRAFMVICSCILLRTRNISDKSRKENQNTFHIQFIFFENCVIYDTMGKILKSQAGYWRQYGASALHAGYLRLHTCTQNM